MGTRDRKAFLISLLRLCAGIGIGLAGLRAAFGSRRRGGLPASPASACARDGICPVCSIVESCGNPQALVYERGRKS